VTGLDNRVVALRRASTSLVFFLWVPFCGFLFSHARFSSVVQPSLAGLYVTCFFNMPVC